MKIHFITINNFSLIPVTRYIINEISNDNEVFLTECYIENQYIYNNVSKISYIGKFRDYYNFCNQSFFFKVWKMIFLITKLIISIVFYNQNIYTPDFQVLNIAIKIKKIFKTKTKIIYHQFELLESHLLREKDEKKWNYIIKNAEQIDLAIFPEVNRLEYFNEITNFSKNKTLLFSNSCSSANLDINTNHALLNDISKNRMIVGHIGQVGPYHYYKKFIEIIEESNNLNLHFVIIGDFDSEVNKAFKEIKNPNLSIIKSLPHKELLKIYPFIEIGFILYKGVDKNFEFCAPNKLYEYWSYGISVIGHKLIGLNPLFSKNELGELFDFNDASSTLTILEYLKKHKSNKKIVLNYFEKNLAIENNLKLLRSEFKKL
jgi:hypothetical protein